MGKTHRCYPIKQTYMWDQTSPNYLMWHKDTGWTNETASGAGAFQGSHYTLKVRKGEEPSPSAPRRIIINQETVPLVTQPITSKDVHFRQFRKRPNRGCPCCFQRNGRIWMLRGTGEKSYGKNKGFGRAKWYERKEQESS